MRCNKKLGHEDRRNILAISWQTSPARHYHSHFDSWFHPLALGRKHVAQLIVGTSWNPLEISLQSCLEKLAPSKGTPICWIIYSFPLKFQDFWKQFVEGLENTISGYLNLACCFFSILVLTDPPQCSPKHKQYPLPAEFQLPPKNTTTNINMKESPGMRISNPPRHKQPPHKHMHTFTTTVSTKVGD